MAVLNYAYLKLKMLGPRGLITILGSFQSAYQCERDAVKYAEANNLDSGASSLPYSRPRKKLLLTTLGQQLASTLDPSSLAQPPALTPVALIVGS